MSLSLSSSANSTTTGRSSSTSLGASASPSSTGFISSTFTEPRPVRPTNGNGFNGTSNGGSQQDNGGSGQSQANASLYLYTFLATLILLLAVSSAIIIRSFILRRRARRMIEEAIANGTWPPPASSNKKSIGKRPELNDVYLGDSESHGVKSETSWDALQPLGVLPTKTDPPAPYSPPRTSSQAITMRSLVPFRNRQQKTSEQSLDLPLEPIAASPEPVQLGFLILMPSKYPHGKGQDDEEGLDGVVLEVGVCRDDVATGKTSSVSNNQVV